jgi:hypothetical protein
LAKSPVASQPESRSMPFDPLQLPFLRIGNLDEIKKRVGEEEFRALHSQTTSIFALNTA